MGRREPMRALGRTWRLEVAFWVAAGVLLLCNLVPFGDWLIYPFGVLGTWAHEMGHGLTAILAGGDFQYMNLYAGGGGTAYHTVTGFPRVFVSAGGLLGPAVAGGAIVVLGSRELTARWVLGALALALGLSLLLWVRSVFGLVAVAALTAGTGWLAFRGPEVLRLVVTQVVGIQMCLECLADFDYMFTSSFVRDGETRLSDTGRIAEYLLLPYWVWGAIIAALALGILALSYWIAWEHEWKPRWPWRRRSAAGPDRSG